MDNKPFVHMNKIKETMFVSFHMTGNSSTTFDKAENCNKTTNPTDDSITNLIMSPLVFMRGGLICITFSLSVSMMGTIKINSIKILI